MGIARPLLNAAARGLLLLTAGCLAGCASKPHPPPVAAPPAVADDPSLDWHPLLPAPFGTLLKDMPLATHEVLLFHDAAHGDGDADSKDCFASDRAPPAFLGAVPRVYLFCFTHDHLTRIEAIVDLPPDRAADIFARGCAVWHTRSTTTSSTRTPAAPPAPAAVCVGQEIGMGYSATLAPAPAAGGAGVAVSFTADASPADGSSVTPPQP